MVQGLQNEESWVKTLTVSTSGTIQNLTVTGSVVRTAEFQVGASGVGAGSEGWVAFSTAFASAPKVFLQSTVGSGWVSVGSTGAGSFYAYSEMPSLQFNWQAAV